MCSHVNGKHIHVHTQFALITRYIQVLRVGDCEHFDWLI